MRSKKLFRPEIFFVAVLLAGIPPVRPRPIAAQAVDVYARPVQAEPSRDFNALHYLIRLKIDIAGKAFEGETTVTLTPLRDGLATVVLDAEEYTVSGVTFETGSPLSFEQSPEKLKVTLPRAAQLGESLSFTVFYRGREPKNGLRFYEASGDRPLLVASNSFPDNVHHWCPCWDYPHDKATHEIIATVPAGNKVAANGRLLSVKEEAGQNAVTYHWLQDRPHSTYLFFLAAAPYVVVEDRLGNVPISYWVYPKHADRARRSFGQTPEMMAFFNKLFDFDYPWAKYDQIEVPFGGGMENTTITAMGEGVVVDERGEIDFPSRGIVSHELAHQWWGDLVTLRTWSETWINESFGTYCDYLYHRHALGDDEGAVDLLGKKNSYLQEARTRYIRPIVFDRYTRPEQNFDRHTYPKGAAVLHMLRDLLGDEDFFRVLSRFLHDHAFQPADTRDFMKTVKETTGRNMDWFFEQWIYKPGHPVFDVGQAWDEAGKAVKLRIRQVQDFSKGIPVYRLPVKIGIVTSRGKAVRTVEVDETEETFDLPAEEKPTLVRFDEGNVLLKEWTFERSEDELLFQLRSDDVIGRMESAGELLRFKDRPPVIEALRNAAEKDPFWAVRESAVRALGQVKGEPLVAFLRSKCSDANAKVRVAAVAALGGYGNRDLAPFLKDVFRRDRSYSVQAAALEALARTGDPSVEAFLKEAEAMSSYRDIIRAAARRALAALKK